MGPTTENTSANELQENFPNSNDNTVNHTANRSQTRGDSGTVKRSLYNKTNTNTTIKRGASGNAKKHSIRQGNSAINPNNVGTSGVGHGINNFMVQQTN